MYMNTCVIVSKQLKWTEKDRFICLHKYIHNMLFKNARVTVSETRQNHWWKYAKQVKPNWWWHETSQATSLKNSEQNLFFTGTYVSRPCFRCESRKVYCNNVRRIVLWVSVLLIETRPCRKIDCGKNVRTLCTVPVRHCAVRNHALPFLVLGTSPAISFIPHQDPPCLDLVLEPWTLSTSLLHRYCRHHKQNDHHYPFHRQKCRKPHPQVS